MSKEDGKITTLFEGDQTLRIQKVLAITQAPHARQRPSGLFDKETVKERTAATRDNFGKIPLAILRPVVNAIKREDYDLAGLLLDRWRFSCMSQEDQVREQELLTKSYERSVQQGRPIFFHPDDYSDLVTPSDH